MLSGVNKDSCHHVTTLYRVVLELVAIVVLSIVIVDILATEMFSGSESESW